MGHIIDAMFNFTGGEQQLATIALRARKETQ